MKDGDDQHTMQHMHRDIEEDYVAEQNKYLNILLKKATSLK